MQTSRKKLIRAFYFVLILTALILSIRSVNFSTERNSSVRPDSENEQSGAWASLQFISTSRAYPELDIPPSAYTNAWNYYLSHFNSAEGSALHSIPSPWYSLGPENVGGRTLSIAIDPTNNFIVWLGSASGGLWKSTSGGIGANPWTYIPTGFPVLGISSIAIDPANTLNMYIGTGETYSYATSVNGLIERPTRGSVGIGILKSTDGGLTWSPSLDWQYQQLRGVWDIQINPLDPRSIYAGTTEGIYKSTDAGNTWTRVMQQLMVMDLLLDPVDTNTIYAGVGNAGSPNPGIYRSTNSGASWTRLSSGLPPATNTGRITLEINHLNHNSLMALVGDLYSTVGIYRSYDKGNTWTSISGLTEIVSYQGWYAKGLCMHGLDSSQVLFGGVYLFGSNQYGDFPSILPNTYDVHPDIHDIVSGTIAPELIYIITDGGLYRSDNFGISFYPCTDGYVTSQSYIGSVSHQDENIMLAGLQDNNTILTTGSPYWDPVVGGDGTFNAIDPNNDFIMYGSSQYLNVRKSTNQGFNFNTILSHSSSSFGGNNVAFVAPFILCPSNTNIIYAAGDSLQRSNDGGNNWFYPSNSPLAGGNVALSMAVSVTNPDSIYVCTAPGTSGGMRVQLSGNGGLNFTDISAGLPNRFPRDICVDPRDSRVVYIAFSGFGAGHLFKSTDAGAHWNDISTSLPDIPFHCVTIDDLHPDTIFAGSDFGVFVSVDAGANWDAMNKDLPNSVIVFDLVYSPHDQSLIAFTHGNGVYRNNLNNLPVAVQDPDKNKFLVELLNNPVTDELRFRLNKAMLTEVSVFDLKGRQVLKADVKAEKSEICRMNTASLSEGVYLLRIQNANSSLTRKFILSRR